MELTQAQAQAFLIGSLSAMQEELGDITLIKALVYTEAARQVEIEQCDLANVLEMNKSTLSRNILDLTSVTSRSAPGPDILRQLPSTVSRRHQRIALTAKGTDLIGRIVAAGNKEMMRAK